MQGSSVEITHDHAADAHEKVEVAVKLGAINEVGMIRCVSKGDAVLVEVVAHRQLAAKGVAPLADRQLAQFVAKVGQHDDHAVDLQDRLCPVDRPIPRRAGKGHRLDALAPHLSDVNDV